MAGGQPQSRSIIFEYRQPEIGARIVLRQVVIFSEKVTVLLADIRIAADGIDDVLPVEHADQTIDAGHVVEQFSLMPLHEAAGDDNPFYAAGFFQFERFADFLERFSFAGLEKSTGIDDHGIGIGGVGGDRDAVLGEQA